MAKKARTLSQYEIDQAAIETARVAARAAEQLAANARYAEASRRDAERRAGRALPPTAEQIAERAAYVARIEALHAAEAVDPRAQYEERMTAAARTYRETDTTGADPLAHTEGREGE